MIFAWAPWITDDYAASAVITHLGGPDQDYDYLGETLQLKDVPTTFVRVPFGAIVYFPSEAMFIVTFWGLVI